MKREELGFGIWGPFLRENLGSCTPLLTIEIEVARSFLDHFALVPNLILKIIVSYFNNLFNKNSRITF